MITKTKKELIEDVKRRAGITLAEAERAVNAITENMTDTIKGLGRFQLAGVGVFTLVKRAPREGHDPRNGNPVSIPGRMAVKFKEAKELKRAVNP